MRTYLERDGVVTQTDSCPNCNLGLTRKYLQLEPGELQRGVQEKFQIVHWENGEWECPDGSGLNPLSDPIMPVSFITLEVK